MKPFGRAIDNHSNFLQVRFPNPFGSDVGVADLHSGFGCFSANLANGHFDTSFARFWSLKKTVTILTDCFVDCKGKFRFEKKIHL